LSSRLGLTWEDLGRAELVADCGNKKARLRGFYLERMMGLEPTTFCMATAR